MTLGIFRLHLLRLIRSMWFVPAAYSLGSIAVLALAPSLSWIVPKDLQPLFRPEALETILRVLASSMLAVAIFSLGTMVSALQAAASAATPRARVLATEDRTALNTISTFIGAFIFSILGIIGISTDFYDEASLAVIFTITIVVIALVIVALISWINRLSNIGGVNETIGLVERAAHRAFETVTDNPRYGGNRLGRVPDNAFPLALKGWGYVQHIDGDALGTVSARLDFDLYLVVRPGSYIDPGRPVMMAGKELSEEDQADLRAAFMIGTTRTFEEDPRFGMIVLSQIALRALSPAINDPGTAIEVLSAATRVLSQWRAAVDKAEAQVTAPRLHALELSTRDVLEDGFRWISRDGAAYFEVATKLQRSLASLAAIDPQAFAKEARALSDEAFERSKSAMAHRADIESLETVRREIGLV